MIIGKTVTIELEENEIEALRVIKDTYVQCTIEDCCECNKCPLYKNNKCIGEIAEDLLLEMGVRL